MSDKFTFENPALRVVRGNAPIVAAAAYGRRRQDVISLVCMAFPLLCINAVVTGAIACFCVSDIPVANGMEKRVAAC